jgi:alpha-glucosidase
MRLKIILLLCLSFSFAARAQSDKTYSVHSPDGNIIFNLSAGKQFTWWANYRQTPVIMPSAIGMKLSSGENWGKKPVIISAKIITVNEVIRTPIYKKAQVKDNYNQLTLTCKGGYGVIIRAYNDGLAYRFFSTNTEEVTVESEEANFKFKEDSKAYLPFVNDPRNKDKFNNSFEALYDVLNLSAIPKDTLAFLPVLVDVGKPLKVALLEADLQNYPGMYLTPGNGNHNLKGIFPAYPTQEENGGYNKINYVVTRRADYIAKTSGARSFPWRVLVISTTDQQLADNDMVQKLSAPSKITDLSWIKPGKVAWDWWNDWNVTHVDFKAGINVPTYKYYIDFAAANHVEYIVMDEGWSDDNDITQFKLDVQQIVDYGKQRNVGVILWSTWYGITRNTDALLSKFSKMGVKGFKIDFIDRDDQKAVASLYEIAQKAAQYHLMVDYHGMYKPSGLQRTWPNVINFEGVKGLENDKWGIKDHPVYDVSIPFIRMLAGPMDYTPGAMRNATKEAFRPSNSNPMSQGTRCHQLAMYTVFEAPLQMMADNPTIYKQEQECTSFIAAIPTVFDETVALDGQVGEYITMARRKGTTWYAGAMTDWTERDLTINLSFLPAGQYRAIIFADGINANRNATDYTRQVITVSGKDKLTVHLAPGGGWAARFEKVK